MLFVWPIPHSLFSPKITVWTLASIPHSILSWKNSCCRRTIWNGFSYDSGYEQRLLLPATIRCCCSLPHSAAPGANVSGPATSGRMQSALSCLLSFRFVWLLTYCILLGRVKILLLISQELLLWLIGYMHVYVIYDGWLGHYFFVFSWFLQNR